MVRVQLPPIDINAAGGSSRDEAPDTPKTPKSPGHPYSPSPRRDMIHGADSGLLAWRAARANEEEGLEDKKYDRARKEAELSRRRICLRVTAMVLCLMIGSGLTPGMSLWVEKLVLSGIGSDVCEQGVQTCDEQRMKIAYSLMGAQVMARNAEYMGAYNFHEFGAHFSVQCGALFNFVGWTLMCFPLIGVRCGFDTFTYRFVDWGGMLINMGTGNVKFAPYELFSLFPGRSGYVLSLASSGYQAGSLYTLCVHHLSKFFGMDFGGILALELILGCVYWKLGPVAIPLDDDEEEHAEEEPEDPDPELLSQTVFMSEQPEAEEDEDPAEPTTLQWLMDETRIYFEGIAKSCKILNKNRYEHLLALLTLGAGPLWAAVYASMAFEYGSKLFDSQDAGEAIASSFCVHTFLAACIASPVIGANIDKIGGHKVLLLFISLMSILAAENIDNPHWEVQQFVIFLGMLLSGVEPILMGNHLFSYVNVELSGPVAATFNLFAFLVYYVTMMVDYNFIGTNHETIEEFGPALKRLGRFGAFCYSCYFIFVLIVKLPQQPVVLEEIEIEKCSFLGCKRFSEAARILNVSKDVAIDILFRKTFDQKSLEAVILRMEPVALRRQLKKLTQEELIAFFKGYRKGDIFWRKRSTESKDMHQFVGMTGITVPQHQLDSALSSIADVCEFGKGATKSLERLKMEFSGGKSALVVDEFDPGKVIRVTEIIVVRITFKYREQIHFLIETGLQYPNGSSKLIFRFPAIKRSPGDSLDGAVKKLLDGLGMQGCNFDYDTTRGVEKFVNTVESPSYPGLMTRYVKHLVGVRIESITDPSACKSFGLMPHAKPVPWQMKHTLYAGRSSSNLSSRWMSGSRCMSFCRRIPEKSESNGADEMVTHKYKWLQEHDICSQQPDFLFHFPPQEEEEITADQYQMTFDLSQMLRARSMMQRLTHCLRTCDYQRLYVFFLENDLDKLSESLASMPYWLKWDNLMGQSDRLMQAMRHMIKSHEQLRGVAAEVLVTDMIARKQCIMQKRGKLPQKVHRIS